MKKQHKTASPLAAPPNNPVAKFAHRFNKHLIHNDKSRYQRKAKHTGLEPFLTAFA